MAEQPTVIISIGPWRIESATGCVTNGEHEFTLRPREIDVLTALVQRAGEVVSVDELLAAAWHGAVVSNDALYFSISQLRKALDDPDCEHSLIETMPKRGYRIAASARLERASVATPALIDSGAITAPPVTPGTLLSRWRSRAALGAVIVLVAIVAVWQLNAQRDPQRHAAGSNSIAVMPFIDLSPEADHTYLSDGISEELLNRLARVPGLQVAARTSSFAFKDQVADVVDIGQSLGVASILEGSVRKDGDRVRIAVQLIDANTGFQLWSDTYDQQLGSVFVLQNEISRRIIDALEPALLSGHPAMVAQTANPAAVEPYLMGLEQQRINTFTSLQRAAELFATALQVDPSFPQAGIALAEAKLDLIEIGASFDRALLAEAKALANQALMTDPGSSEAYREIARVAMMNGESEKSEALLQKALDLAPSNSIAMIDLAQIKAKEGDTAAARRYLQQALQIDPYGDVVLMKLGHLHWTEGRLEQARNSFERGALVHPQNPIFPMMLGMLQVLNLGELAGGLQNFLLAAELDPQDFEIAAYVAMSYLTLGMPDDARPWIDRAVRLGPLAASSLALESSWLAQKGDLPSAVRLSASVLANGRYIFRGHKLLWEPHYVIGIGGLIENGQAGSAIALLEQNRAVRANQFILFAGKQPTDADTEADDMSAGKIRWLLSLASAQRAAGLQDESASVLEQVAERAKGPLKYLRYRGVGQQLLEAEIRALQGDRDAALDLLEQVAEHGPVFNWQVQIRLNNAFAGLHSSERYQELLTDMQAAVSLQRQRLPAMSQMSQSDPPAPIETLPE